MRHGFHGRASNDPWQLVESDGRQCRARWEGHGLAAERRMSVTDALSVTTEVTALDDDVPIVALEHLALGLELIEPSVELELPGARASELDDSLGPVDAARDCAGVAARSRWPGVAARAATAGALADERGRVFVVRDLPAGRAVVRNPERGHGVEITWTAEVLPHLLVWHEARASGGVWRNATEVLCIEPCSVPHLLGPRGGARRRDRLGASSVARRSPGR